MISTLEKVNNEKMNEAAFHHLSSEMKGVVLHSLADQLRNEEIMAQLSLSEKELKELCVKYGVTYGFRNTERRLDGEKVISEVEIDALIQEGAMHFTDFLQYNRPSQRQIVFAFVAQTGKLTKTIRAVFDVKFFTFFTSLYYEEKALRTEQQTEEETMTNVHLIEPAEQRPLTADELYEYVTTPTENNPNNLAYLSDTWDSPFGVEKQYMIQFKNQQTTKRQLKLQLRYLLDEIDELEPDALLSVELKITEHTPKK